MRILDVNNNYAPTGGGVRTYHHQKLAYYDETEHLAALVVPSDHYGVSHADGLIRYHVPGIAMGKSGYRQIVRGKHLAKAIADFAPDIIEVGSAYTMPPLIQRMVQGRIPTVGFYHADYPDTYVAPALEKLPGFIASSGTRLANRHMGKTYSAMTATFGASEFVLNKLAAQGVRRLFRTPLGVDIKQFHPTHRSEAWRAEHGIGPDDTMILFLARLAHEKGLQRLLDAYPALVGPHIKLVIAGHGPMSGEVDKLKATYPNVTTLGYVSDQALLSRLYATADVFLSLGTHETFSLATIEALASGTPVVAPDAGGAGEIVGRSSLPVLFVPEDAASLVQAIKRVAGAGSGAKLTARRFAAEAHSWERTFATHTENYERIIAAHEDQSLDALIPEGPWWNP